MKLPCSVRDLLSALCLLLILPPVAPSQLQQRHQDLLDRLREHPNARAASNEFAPLHINEQIEILRAYRQQQQEGGSQEHRDLVIGGEPVPPGRFPYITLIGVIINGDPILGIEDEVVRACTAALVHRDVALTTGRCIPPEFQTFASYLTILAIVNFTTWDSEPKPPSDLFPYTHKALVSSFAPHPNFNSTAFPNATVVNNGVFLKIDPPAPTSFTPIVVNGNAKVPSVGQSTVFLDIGIINKPQDQLSDEVDGVQFSIGPVRRHSTCQSQLNTVKQQNGERSVTIVDQLQFCAQGQGRGACINDFSGSLIVRGNNPYEDRLVGMLNFMFFETNNPNHGCGTFPQVYTRTSALKTALDNFICDESDFKPPSCRGGGGDSGVYCFSASQRVQTSSRGTILMQDLKVGDMVQVQGGAFEPVYAFGHFQPDSQAPYVRLTLTRGVTLELSANHMVLLSSGHFVAASRVKLGSTLVLQQEMNEALQVIAIDRHLLRKGAFAPFTPSGTIVVNGIVASTYIAYDDTNENVKFGKMNFSWITHQWAGHAFTSIHRIIYKLTGGIPETYTVEGVHTWVATPHHIAQWLQHQHAAVALVGMTLFVVVFGSLAVLDDYFWTVVWASTVAIWFVARRNQKQKLAKGFTNS